MDWTKQLVLNQSAAENYEFLRQLPYEEKAAVHRVCSSFLQQYREGVKGMFLTVEIRGRELTVVPNEAEDGYHLVSKTVITEVLSEPVK